MLQKMISVRINPKIPSTFHLFPLLLLISSVFVGVVDAFWIHANSNVGRSFLYSHGNLATRRYHLSSSASITDQEVKQSSNHDSDSSKPQVLGTGFSNLVELPAALEDALRLAMGGIPSIQQNQRQQQIDLCVVTVSSLYDGSSSTSAPITSVVPFLLQKALDNHNVEILNLIGCTSAGLVSTVHLTPAETTTIESEGSFGVSITLCILPDTQVMTFHVENDAVSEDTITKLSPAEWRQKILGSITTTNNPTVFLLPSPAFHNNLDYLLRGLSYAIPPSQTFGAVASTVSSLSRARLFQYSKKNTNSSFDEGGSSSLKHTHGRGCVGVLFQGDAAFDVFIARGAKPVGGVYRIATGEGSIIRSLTLDEEMLLEKNGAARTGKPRPPLAEANYLLKNILSDDEATFMKSTLLIGVENNKNGSNSTDNDLDSLSQGGGHAYAVYQVANAGMKDGSVTLPLGSVDLQIGQRVRFFVREAEFAKQELHALWSGYQQVRSTSATPTGCFMFPSLDRGVKLFGGKPGYESSIVSENFIPNVQSISGFFSNGVIGPLNGVSPALEISGVASEINKPAVLHGSATCYAVIKSKSNRPRYLPGQIEEIISQDPSPNTQNNNKSPKDLSLLYGEKAPRAPDGELILRRREIHSGRSLTVSTVEWSVAEKKAVPTSALEGWMWEKETEVDRFRERVPLANLLSQVKQFMDVTKPRDWAGVTFSHSDKAFFTIIPELKRSEPQQGALRARYKPAQLVEELSDIATSLSVNSDGLIFGGSLDDVSTVRLATTLPILVSDLILYPYQLYQMRLAGADAVVFVTAALSTKDLVYLTKISSSLGLQSVVSVTSEVQLDRIVESNVNVSSIASLVVSNRNWEDFSVDESGEQALRILRSNSMALLLKKFPGVRILVEGRVGLIQKEGNISEYVKALKESGVSGAIVSRAFATMSKQKIGDFFSLNR